MSDLARLADDGAYVGAQLGPVGAAPARASQIEVGLDATTTFVGAENAGQALNNDLHALRDRLVEIFCL